MFETNIDRLIIKQNTKNIIFMLKKDSNKYSFIVCEKEIGVFKYMCDALLEKNNKNKKVVCI